jgi:hypothetical protein
MNRSESQYQALVSLALALVVIAAQMALVAVIYWPTLGLAFVSDAWVYLDRLRHGLWPAVMTPVGYHYQPVTVAWDALIRAVFGETAAAFQAVSMVQLGLLGFLTYRLGVRLLPDAGTAFLGSLLLLGNAAFYEVSYWPLAGNMQFLGAQLYVLAVILAHDVAHGRFGGAGPWMVALVALAAIFSHPAMVTVLPVCALTFFLASEKRADDRLPADAPYGKLKALLPLGVAAGVFGLTRIAFAKEIVTGLQPGFGRMRAYWLALRGIVAVFSLRGSHEAVHWLLTLGTNAGFSTPLIWVYVAGWLALAGGAAGLCFLFARRSGTRLLVGFLTIHLLAVGIASDMASRESHLPAVPAALLTALALRVVADWLATLPASPGGAALCRELPGVAVLLLILAAQADHITAARVHARAANASRGLVEQITRVAPPEGPPVNLTLVNMPGYIVERGIGAAAFSNGLTELTRLNSTRVATLELCQLSIPGAPTPLATGSQPVSLAGLRSRLADPHHVVLLFEMEPFGARVLTADRLESLGSQRAP